MSWRDDQFKPLPVKEAFSKLTIAHLRPLVALLSRDVPQRKPELVALLARFLTNPNQVRALYERLDPLAQKAVQEAAHDPRGMLHHDRFLARRGELC
jgi:hypothetical protein